MNKQRTMNKNQNTPILFPYEPEVFWAEMRELIREEVQKNNTSTLPPEDIRNTPGMVEKPLYKIIEVCTLFKITKPTVYDWIKHGKLKRVKIRSRVYFLGNDIRELMKTG